MRTLHLAVPLTLLATLPLQGQTWTEQAAGETLATVEATIGNGALTTITGNLANTSGADLYLIHVDDAASFSATTVGGATWDTQLFVFTRDGYGVTFRDDFIGLQSTVTGQFLSGPGYFILGVSQFDVDPLDASNQELWIDTPYNSERAPDGPGAANPFTHWSGLSTGPGAYTITLTGASYAGPITPNQAAVAWAWVDVTGVAPASFTPSLFYQHTPTGELITVDHPATGRFVVNLPGSMDAGGTVVVTAYGNNNTAVTEYWGTGSGKLQIHVSVLSTAGALTDGNFSLHYREGGAPTERAAYLWASQPSSASYTPSTSYSWNGNRADPTITRSSAGTYLVTLPGLSTAASSEGGHVEVSAYSGFGSTTLQHAKVASWGSSGADMLISVLTFNAAGAAADEFFTLSYHEKAAPIPKHLGSGAHVWANNPTAASYTPAPFYTDSNGTFGPPNSETITRSGPGNYSVFLPNVAPFSSSIATATAYGSGSSYASIGGWFASGTGTVVSVLTYNNAGTLTDSTFDLNYLTNRPAGTPGTNTVIGGGCNGPVMSGMTRPVLGNNWNLALGGVPGSAVAALVLVGVNNPSLSLGFLGAPGCVLYNDLIISPSVPLPIVNPAYSLAIPNNPIFVGTTFYAQGALIAPGFNALNIITSNGIRGVIGDV